MSHLVNKVNTFFLFPLADGTANQVMQTDGNGQLSWVDQSGGSDTLNDVLSRGATTTTTMTTGTIRPSTTGTYLLGDGTREWAGLTLSDLGIIYFGNDGDTRLEHDPDEGLTLKLSTSEAGNTKPKFTLEAGGTTQGSEIVQVNLRTSSQANDVLGYWIGNGRGATGSSFYDFTQVESVIVDPTVANRQGAVVTKVVVGASNSMLEGLKVFSDDATTANPKVRISNSFTLPATDGSANQVLQTDGNGTVSWATASSGGYSVNVSTLLDQDYSPLSYSSSNDEEYYIMTPSTNRTITLPDISTNSIPNGYKVNFKNMSSSSTITVQPNSSASDELDGSTSITHVLSTQYESITIVCDGSGTWYRV